MKSKYQCIMYGHFFPSNDTVEPQYENIWDELLTKEGNGWGIADIEFGTSLETIARKIKKGEGKFATDGSTKNANSLSGNVWWRRLWLIYGRQWCARNRRRPKFVLTRISWNLRPVVGSEIHLHQNEHHPWFSCDNKSALNNAFVSGLAERTMPSYEILQRIRNEMKDSPLTFQPIKVKGHKDKTTAYEDLDMWAKANCWADGTTNILWILTQRILTGISHIKSGQLT